MNTVVTWVLAVGLALSLASEARGGGLGNTPVHMFRDPGIGAAVDRVADNDVQTKMKKSMGLLKEMLGKLGAPKLDGTANVAGKDVPAIFFGSAKINSNFDAVDEVAKQMGGIATVFVKAGDDYIRVSTNLLKDDGTRAIGTPLAHNPAYKAINDGQAFYGELEILGKPYDTAYEPIKDASGKTIGIYFVGYKKG